MKTVAEINQAILAGNFTSTDLIAIGDAIVFKRNQLARVAKYAFRVGSQVQFTNSRTGLTHFGTVVKVNPKKTQVRVDSTRMTWNVPSHMLSAAK